MRRVAWIQVRFILTNVGPGDGHGAVDVMRNGPALDETRSAASPATLIRWKAKPEKYRLQGSTRLNIPRHETRKTKNGYRLTLRAKEYELEPT